MHLEIQLISMVTQKIHDEKVFSSLVGARTGPSFPWWQAPSRSGAQSRVHRSGAQAGREESDEARIPWPFETRYIAFSVEA